MIVLRPWIETNVNPGYSRTLSTNPSQLRWLFFNSLSKCFTNYRPKPSLLYGAGTARKCGEVTILLKWTKLARHHEQSVTTKVAKARCMLFLVASFEVLRKVVWLCVRKTRWVDCDVLIRHMVGGSSTDGRAFPEKGFERWGLKYCREESCKFWFLLP